MKITETTAKLIYDLEYLIGNNCYNPNSYDGYTGEEGKEFRYPVYIYENEKDDKARKFRGKIHDISGEQIRTMKYKFGSNHLFIGNAIIDVLNALEERYGIDFNKLEEKQK